MCAVQCSAVHCAVQCSAVQCSVVCSAVQCSVQSSQAQKGVAAMGRFRRAGGCCGVPLAGHGVLWSAFRRTWCGVVCLVWCGVPLGR